MSYVSILHSSASAPIVVNHLSIMLVASFSWVEGPFCMFLPLHFLRQTQCDHVGCRGCPVASSIPDPVVLGDMCGIAPALTIKMAINFLSNHRIFLYCQLTLSCSLIFPVENICRPKWICNQFQLPHPPKKNTLVWFLPGSWLPLELALFFAPYSSNCFSLSLWWK